MTYCLNPGCAKPQNSDQGKFCCHCGTKLLLGDRYRALYLMGQGGFGRTFQAVDEFKPSRPACAIKQFIPLNLGVQQGEKALDLFRQEAERLEQLGQHPQIPLLLAHFHQQQQQYLVQEFITGLTLAQELVIHGRFREDQIRALLVDMLPVLEFVHQHHVIHRDIKPDNIIRRGSDQKLVLVDFGAAKFATESMLLKTGTVISTAGYTAPEQLLGKAVYASDLYSLGVTCIHLLTGVAPAELYDSSEDTWIWRRALPTPMSDRLGRVLDQMLQRATRRRYAFAPEVLNDLQVSGDTPGHFVAQSGSGTKSSSNHQSGTPRHSGSTSRQNPASTASVQPSPPGQSWQCFRTLHSHSSPIVAIAITSQTSQREEILVTTSEDGTIKLWDLSSQQLQGILGEHSGRLQAIALVPNSQLLICGREEGQLSFWDLQTGELSHHLRSHSRTLQVLAQAGDVLVSSGGDDLASAPQRSGSGFRSLSYNHRLIKLWHLPTGELRLTLAAETSVYALALSPVRGASPEENGLILASGGKDGMIRVWNIESGTLLQRLHWQLGPVQAIAISPDGQFLAGGGYDGTIKLWHLHNRQPWKSFGKHLRPVRSLCFSPDTQMLASGGEDHTLKLWHLPTGQLLTSEKSHSAAITTLAFSGDGQILVSGSLDKTIKFWRSETG